MFLFQFFHPTNFKFKKPIYAPFFKHYNDFKCWIRKKIEVFKEKTILPVLNFLALMNFFKIYN